jgi:hypothetical protein
MDVEDYVLIEIAFSVYNIPACQAKWENYWYYRTDISNARHLAYKLLKDYNHLNCLEISRIFDFSKSSVSTAIKRLNKIIKSGEMSGDYYLIRFKYYDAISLIPNDVC